MNLRIVQKKKKCSGFVEEQGRFVHKEWSELASWKIQVQVDQYTGNGLEHRLVWEDVPVIEEWEDE